jgi:hypothetical protein
MGVAMRACRFVRWGISAAVVLALTPAAAVAQNTGIAGIVRDTSGAVLPGVTVEASSPALIEKVRSVITDSDGLYQIVDLRPGEYAVTFALPGFSGVKRDGIQLTTSFTATVNVELSVGALEETIVVSGQAAAVDTRNVVQRQVLTEEVRSALPIGRSIQTMAAIIPGMVQTAGNRPSGQDVGGLTGERANIQINGNRLGDMTIAMDGLPFNLALGNGMQQLYSLNPAETQEYVYNLSAGAADTLTGVVMSAIPKEGGNRYSAFFFGSYVNGAFQADNVTPELRAQGLQAANPIRRFYDFNGSVGGPLREDKLWFFTAVRAQDAYEEVTGMYRPIDPASFVFNPALGAAGNVDLNRPATYDSWLQSYSTRLTWQAHSKHKVSAYFANQPNGQTPQGITATNSYEGAFLRTTPITYMTHVSWKSTLSSRLLVEAGVISPNHETDQAPIVDGVPLPEDRYRVSDTGTGYTYRSGGYHGANHLIQPTTRAAVSYVTGSHVAKVGVDFGWGSNLRQDVRNLGNMTYGFVNGVPRTITVTHGPYTERERNRNFAFYGQDQWALSRLTINAGLRFDYMYEWIPEQTNGPGFTPFQTWAAVKDVASWKDLSPRLGVAYDLFGDGRTALKATVSRYVVREGTGFAAAANPLLFNASANRSWTDTNGDFFPQETELGPLSNPRFGTGATTTTIDRSISHGWGVRPYSWEIGAGVQRELTSRVSLTGSYTRRWYGNFVVTDNLALTPADYDEYCITAPTHDRLGSVSGTRMCGLYNLTPAAFSRSPENIRTLASNYGKHEEFYNGVSVSLTARLPHRSQLFGGFSTGTSNNSGNALVNSVKSCYVVDSPQALRNCDGTYPWRTQIKAYGTVGLPWGIDLATTFQTYPGQNIAANYTVTSAQVQFLNPARTTLTGGTATFPLTETSALFADRVYQVDLRASKTFSQGAMRFRAILDIGNLMNASPVLLQNNTYGSNWLRPGFILPGRLVKPTLEITF